MARVLLEASSAAFANNASLRARDDYPFKCYEHYQEFWPDDYRAWVAITFALFFLVALANLGALWLRVYHPDFRSGGSDSKRRASTAGTGTDGANAGGGSDGGGRRLCGGACSGDDWQRKLLKKSVRPLATWTIFYFCFCRLLWLCDPHANSKGLANDHIFGEVTHPDDQVRTLSVILLSTPQALALTSATALVTLWRRVAFNAQSLRRNAASLRVEARAVLGGCLYLVGFTIPLQFLSGFGVVPFIVADGAFGLYMLVMICAGVYYVIKLGGVARKLQRTSRARADGSKPTVLRAVIKIEQTVGGLLVCGLMIIGGIVYNTVAISRCDLPTDADANKRRLGYIWAVHVGEAIGLLSLIYGVLPLSKSPKVGGGGVQVANAATPSGISGSDTRGSFSNSTLEQSASAYAVSEEDAAAMAEEGGGNDAARDT